MVNPVKDRSGFDVVPARARRGFNPPPCEDCKKLRARINELKTENDDLQVKLKELENQVENLQYDIELQKDDLNRTEHYLEEARRNIHEPRFMFPPQRGPYSHPLYNPY